MERNAEGSTPGESVHELRETPLDEPVEEFLTAKSKGRTSDTGTYQRNLRRDVENFLAFLEDEPRRPPETFGHLSDRHLRQYARHLDRADLADGTVLTYYSNVSAYLGWCVREGYLGKNPAQSDRAKEPLPEDDGRRSGEKQAWTSEQRQAILRHVDDRADETLDQLGGPDSVPASDRDRWTAIKALRDRAFVYLLSYSGIRGAEILAHGEDDRRDGAEWSDLSVEDARVTVLAKTQDPDDRALPEPIHGPLERYERLLAPQEDWPLFPSLHRPSLYQRLREHPDVDEDRVGEVDTWDLFRGHGIRPPALSTDGGRRILKQLTEEAGIDVDDEHEYLTMHGARRGAGEVMVRAKGYAAAARLLDDTERMVRERYSHIEAGELAEQATEAFDAVDR